MKIFMTLLLAGLLYAMGYVLYPVLFPEPTQEVVVERAVQRDFEVRMDDGRIVEFNLDELSRDEYPKHLVTSRVITLTKAGEPSIVKVRANSKLNIVKVEGDLATVTLRDASFTGQVSLGDTDFFKRIVIERDRIAALNKVAPKEVKKAVVQVDEVIPAREVIVEGLQNGEFPTLNEALISELTELSSKKEGKETIRKIKISYLTALFFGAETEDLIVTLNNDKVIEWDTSE